ncbi:hypothetical protein [Dictyobacter kobayashii]|uniref:hypothetical protein n=1 Tax=Dictyobacter kobayashii TaxID=2014872 RepID=UPI000F843EF6|nr:hypothetical protein [Dictyobacter kobayashii]
MLISLVLPGFLMVISSYTNAWAFTGGNLTFSTWAETVNTLDAVFRGLFVEALVFTCFKLVKMLCSAKDWRLYFAALIPGFVGLVAVIVSAGCGLAWVIKSGSMDWMVHAIAQYLPSWVVGVFQSGMGLLFPVSLMVLAIYDLGSLIEEHIHRGIHLRSLAMRVQSAEHHQTMLSMAQQEANEDAEIQNSYKDMARVNARQAVDAARNGDYTFGFAKVTEQLPASGPTQVKRISPNMSYPGLSAPPTPNQLRAPGVPPIAPQASYINGQYTTNVAPTGVTQPITIPPAPMPQPEPSMVKRALSWMGGATNGAS